MGLYVTCYYLGESTGAILPAPVWKRAGWAGCVALVVLVLVAKAALVTRFRRSERPDDG